MKKYPIDPELVSSGLENLLKMVGIQMPLVSEILKTSVNHWIKFLPQSELKNYMFAIREAKRVGSNVRRTLQKVIALGEGEDRAVIKSLFLAYLLASIFLPGEESEDEKDEGRRT